MIETVSDLPSETAESSPRSPCDTGDDETPDDSRDVVKIVTFSEDDRWAELGDVAALSCLCATAVVKALDGSPAGEAAVLLANDETLRDLNARFRGKDAPTNVLAFPDASPERLGDIAIAFEAARQEAAEQGKSLRDHVAHLIIHGLLHLAGYDHQIAEQADEMERLEIDALQHLEIGNPYTY